MGPKQYSPDMRPSAPQGGVPGGFESYPQVSQPEIGQPQVESAPERMPATPGETLQAPPTIPILPAPDPVVTQAQPTATPAQDSTIPMFAADDDLIEKEWIDKAKQVVAATKEDPHRREVEVGKLQVEYIFKRYGRKIGDPGDKK